MLYTPFLTVIVAEYKGMVATIYSFLPSLRYQLGMGRFSFSRPLAFFISIKRPELESRNQCNFDVHTCMHFGPLRMFAQYKVVGS